VRAFVSFLVALIVVGAVGYAGMVYMQQNADKFKKGSLPEKIGHELKAAPPSGPVPRGPLDYHVLEAQGGEPRPQAEQAGLITDKWAYLAALEPVQLGAGVLKAERMGVRGKTYDLCYRFGDGSATEQYLEFALAEKWEELHFGFGFEDKEPSDPTNEQSIEFAVVIDGVTAYGPVKLTPVMKPVFARLSVKGANRVVFSSRRLGQNNTFSPVLLDPFVRLAEPAPADLKTGQTSAPAG
jgi:hypothetical protein